MRHSYHAGLGLSAALSRTPLSFEWFEAVCDTEEEARNLAFQTNAERATADLGSRRAK